MTKQNIYKIVCKMRDAYQKQVRSKKKIDFLSMFSSGMCLYLRYMELGDDKEEILEFIKKYGSFYPSLSHWFPKGQCKPRLELMNKAIANYELKNIYPTKRT